MLNMTDSDDDSSDSSNDFAGITPKDELTASFFSIKPVAKPNLVNAKDDSEDESSDDENFTNVPKNNDIELFSEVVKNLEASQKVFINDEEPKQHFSKDNSTQVINESKMEKKKNISDEITAVLLQGESGTHAFREDDEETSDDEKQEEEGKRPEDYTIPKEGVKIILPGTSMIFKKKSSNKKETDLTALLRRKLKANQIIIEKAARLCWLAHGFHLNHQANDPEIMATVVSLFPARCYPKNFNLEYLAKFTKWFINRFMIKCNNNEVIINKETLLKRIAEKKIYNYRELVILYVAIMRGIGIHCRLVLSLNPPLVKAYNELLPKTSTVKKESKVKEKESKVKEKTKETKTKKISSKEDKKNVDSKIDVKNNSVIQNDKNARRNANVEAKKKAAEILRSKYSYNKKNKDKLNSNISIQDKASTSKNVEVPSTSSKTVEPDPSPRRLRSNKVHSVLSTSVKHHDIEIISENKQKIKNSKRQSGNNSLSSEEEEPPSKSKRKCSSKNTTDIKPKGKNEKRDQPLTDEETDNKLKEREDVWAEVYVESKASWICVNVMSGNVDCVGEIYVSNSRQ